MSPEDPEGISQDVFVPCGLCDPDAKGYKGCLARAPKKAVPPLNLQSQLAGVKTKILHQFAHLQT